jgi:hypothetical protein
LYLDEEVSPVGEVRAYNPQAKRNRNAQNGMIIIIVIRYLLNPMGLLLVWCSFGLPLLGSCTFHGTYEKLAGFPQQALVAICPYLSRVLLERQYG